MYAAGLLRVESARSNDNIAAIPKSCTLMPHACGHARTNRPSWPDQRHGVILPAPRCNKMRLSFIASSSRRMIRDQLYRSDDVRSSHRGHSLFSRRTFQSGRTVLLRWIHSSAAEYQGQVSENSSIQNTVDSSDPLRSNRFVLAAAWRIDARIVIRKFGLSVGMPARQTH